MFLGLEIGSWAEWFGAFASFLAVVTALFLPYFSNKASARISYEPSYSNSQNSNTKKLDSFTIRIYNKGGVPFQITEIGLSVKENLNIILDDKYSCLYLNSKSIYEVEVVLTGIKRTLIDKIGNCEVYRLQPYMIDGSRKRFKGKKIEIKKSDF